VLDLLKTTFLLGFGVTTLCGSTITQTQTFGIPTPVLIDVVCRSRI
jgi:hypothetical protein